MYRLGGGHMGDPLFLQRRASVIEKYGRLRHTHPALPADLRDFQVYIWQAAEGRVQNKNTKCPIDAHCSLPSSLQKRSKNYKELY